MMDAEQILRDLVKKIAPENNFDNDFEIKSITSEGANYTSVLFLVNAKADGKDVKLFAKVACIGEEMRVAMSADKLYTIEQYFYNTLSNTYRQLERKHVVGEEDRFVMPKVYGCDSNLNQETVVLENLVARGYDTPNRFESIDWEQASASIIALAKLHALSFAFQKERPEEFADSYKLLQFDQKMPEDEAMLETWQKMLLTNLSGLTEERRGRVLKFIESQGNEIYLKLRSPREVPVIVHGDYRPSNLLFKKEGKKLEVIPVDYQTLHIGCPAADLIYFEMLGTDGAFREKYHEDLLNCYHDNLSAALDRLGLDATEVYSRDVFDREIEDMLPFSVFIGCGILSLVLVEAEKAPKFDGNLDNMVAPVTDLFQTRFSEIVEDCVRWGAI